MPELPEVEVTRRGIKDYLLKHKIVRVWHDDKKLRVPFSENLLELEGGYVQSVDRRAKYIIIATDHGSLLIHIGMTGHLSVTNAQKSRNPHDHFEIEVDTGSVVRMNDIRRFGMVVYYPKGVSPYEENPLSSLGPEPFDDAFNPEYLKDRLAGLKKSIKQALMDNNLVVGIGNIYANEVLFECRIDPRTISKNISFEQCKKLVGSIRDILDKSIRKGGTTIRNFQGADGKLGYYVQDLLVYGHEGEPCRLCGSKIEKIVQGQRSTFFCPNCQK